jgi:hypothetical protein
LLVDIIRWLLRPAKDPDVNEAMDLVRVLADAE